ncbi:MAG: hypothetical protein U0790_28375 [Isosphaeraceae bacterium]
MRNRLVCLGLCWTLSAGVCADRAPGQSVAQEQPVNVDPTELDRRVDLAGRMITVDDRLLYYQFHQGRGYDELRLKRTNVVFRLPPPLRPESPPRPTPIVVQGRLRRDADQLVCDVVSLRIVPNDLDRLNQAISALPARDFETRKAWAAWAEKRGRDFKEPALTQRAGAILTEALRIEADQSRGAVDAPTEWLRLAEDARRRKLAEPEPSALAHRALRARFAGTTTVQGAKDLLSTIERFFPEAARVADAARAEEERWRQSYEADPAGAYRQAPPAARKALDRRLWSDARQKQIELEAADDPQAAITLAPRAEAELPDRPEFAAGLLKRGLDLATRNLASLRLSELKSVGEAYRDKLKDPDRAFQVYRDWLKLQRDKLSPTDAEGPVDLAGLYDELLQDRTAARELLEQAWKIDPGSKQIGEAFRARGYRRVNDQWVEETAPTAAGDAGKDRDPNASAPPAGSRGLRGMTPEEVSQLLRSAPDRKVISATKGQLVEQWIFRLPTQRRWRYVNFVQSPGDLRPRVVSDYSLPEAIIGKGITNSR